MHHQLITPDCQLIPAPAAALKSKNTEYHIISIFGSQSTGKSTLLNHLFDTQFTTMTSRSRTTRGIIQSESEINPECSLIILDVEGTDGREHGEDNSFERKSALFTLSVSSVIIMNIFENMVGLYNGANLGLLRTVLDVNREINSTISSKTLLLFVVRDYAGVSSEEELTRVIRESLEEIWNSLMNDSITSTTTNTLYDYFDISLFTLPHKILQPNEFRDRVLVLRSLFSSPHSEYLSQKYHKNIPIDGLAHYTKSIWQTINANKSLDIPTQQSLLAQYRIDEIIKELIESIISNNDDDDDTTTTTTTMTILLDQFDKSASKYNTQVYERKRVEFEERVRVVLRDRFMVAYKRVYNSTVEAYKRDLIAAIQGDYDGIVELDRRVEEEFITAISALNTTADPPFEYDSLDLVSIKQPLTQERVFELKDEFMSRMKRTMMQQLVEERLFKCGDTTAAALKYPSDLIAKESLRLNHIVTTLLGHSEIEVDLRGWFSGVLRDVIDETLVRRWFDAEFKYCVDDRRRLVEYGSVDEMSERWRECVEIIEGRLESLSRITQQDSSLSRDTIISHDKLISLKNQLRLYAEQCYSEYKRQREAATIPPYVYILLLVLGFNEITYILSMIISSPLTSMLLLLLVILAVFVVRNRDNHVVRMLVRIDVLRDVVFGIGEVMRPVLVGVLDGIREMVEDKRKSKSKSE